MIYLNKKRKTEALYLHGYHRVHALKHVAVAVMDQWFFTASEHLSSWCSGKCFLVLAVIRTFQKNVIRCNDHEWSVDERFQFLLETGNVQILTVGQLKSYLTSLKILQHYKEVKIQVADESRMQLIQTILLFQPFECEIIPNICRLFKSVITETIIVISRSRKGTSLFWLWTIRSLSNVRVKKICHVYRPYQLSS